MHGLPRSILLGRPWPKEGEPLFTAEDTDYVIALAMEEAETCPSCRMLKSICRDPGRQFAFEVHEEQCHVTRALADHGEKMKDRPAALQKATQASVRFREGMTPPIDVGLGLEDYKKPDADDSDD